MRCHVVPSNIGSTSTCVSFPSSWDSIPLRVLWEHISSCCMDETDMMTSYLFLNWECQMVVLLAHIAQSTTQTLLKDQLTSFTHVLCSQSYTGEEAFDLFHFFSNGGSCSTLIFPTPLYLQHTHTKHTHNKQKKFDLSILASFIMVDLYLLKKIHLTSHFVAWPFACITERNGFISRRFFVSGKAWVTFSK